MPLLVITLLALLTLSPQAQAIVGGRPASQPYPHMAQLEVDGDFICGASLVRASWVLTAAHCVEDEDGGATAADRLKVVLGRVRLSDGGGETLAVASVVQHPDYAGNAHDVALLKLASPSAQPPVRIVTTGEGAIWDPGTSGRVTAWGAVVSGGGASDELREVDVTIRDDGTCSTSAYATVGYEPETMFCAGEPLGGRDSCQGDSGGPLTVPDAAGRTTLVGVVSGGVGCALPASYGVYARLGGAVLAGWLAQQLPAVGEPPPPPPGAEEPAVTVTKRLRMRRGRVRLALSTNVGLSDVRVRLTRRGRLVARGRVAALEGRRTLKLRPRRALRSGKHRVSVTGTAPERGRITLRATARR